jgi:hypothetical protein
MKKAQCVDASGESRDVVCLIIHGDHSRSSNALEVKPRRTVPAGLWGGS